MKTVYADYAAATPTDPRVIQRVSEVSETIIGNPSSRHQYGRMAEESLNKTRTSVASFLNAKPEEVYFTSSGTESNNLAILGFARANRNKGNHIVTTAIEHPSVLNACRALERDGFAVTYLPVDHNGQISIDEFTRSLTERTILVSIHLANSEIGVVQNVARLAAIAKQRGCVFHTDACQAAAFLNLDVEALGTDLLTFNGSKLYGPRGIAVLYVRENVALFPLIYGGGQEGSLRNGTENLPGIAGLSLACEITTNSRDKDSVRIGKLRDKLQAELESRKCVINAKEAKRLPNHLSVQVFAQDSDIVAAFDRSGIAISSGSACSSRSQVDSHVLTALGLTSEAMNRTVRVTLGRPTTEVDARHIVATVKKISRPQA